MNDFERRSVSVFSQLFQKIVRRAVRFSMLLIDDYRVRVDVTSRIRAIFRKAFRDIDTRQGFEDHIRDHLIHRILIRSVVSFVEIKCSLFDERNVDFEFLL